MTDTRAFRENLGTWRGGRVRTIAALADMDVNLDFFGLAATRRRQCKVYPIR